MASRGTVGSMKLTAGASSVVQRLFIEPEESVDICSS